jgi:hypothetical protein
MTTSVGIVGIKVNNKNRDEEKKYLEEKHNRGVIINDDDQDWGG